MTDHERLVELLSECFPPEFPWDHRGAEADYLLEHGVIAPPCKVGDTVYYRGGVYSRVVKSATIVEIIVNFRGVSELLVTDENNVTFQDSIDIFYLTREEAEAALAEKIKAPKQLKML